MKMQHLLRIGVCFAIVFAAIVVGYRWLERVSAQSVKSANPFRPTPAGRLIVDSVTGLAAVAPLTVDLVRSPDSNGPDGKGRYLIAVNSGYGVQFTSQSKAQQTLSVIDLAGDDARVIQTIYFPSPQSANVGCTAIEYSSRTHCGSLPRATSRAKAV